MGFFYGNWELVGYGEGVFLMETAVDVGSFAKTSNFSYADTSLQKIQILL